ncbi:MAG TPA: hypothetical protein VFF76_07720 [Holophagaceae bacterium]|jgi:uncharacterized membrane protein|nr:hypothetical protein [Holophagaceae bacterium]
MNPTMESIPFSRADISPLAFLSEAWARVKDRYWLFLGITAAGLLLGSAAPLALLLGPMMCGIYLCYRRQAQGLPITFDMLFKGFGHFTESFIASLLMLAASLVLILPMMMAIFVVIFAGVLSGIAGHGAQEGIGTLGCLMFAAIFLFVMLGSLLIGVFFTFTYPLILDRGLTGLEAVKLSFRAAHANLGGLLLLALVNALLTFAGLLCCYVGALFVLPLTFGTHWICYERVFGIKET